MSEGILRILLVEDNPIEADLLQKTLGQVEGQLQITRVDCLQQAVEYLQHERKVDTILLDLGLPDSAGIATLEQVACAAPNLPIIALTALDDEATGIEAVHLGAQDYLVKGQTKPRMLLRAIHHAIERKQMEAALRESEARFRKVFDHAATGIAITDCVGHFIQCNAAYCDLTGYSQTELAAFVFPALVHPEDRDRNMPFIGKLLSGELPSFEIECRYIRKDSTIVWGHTLVSLLRDDRGEPTHMIALVTDTTERKRVEEALQTARIEAIIEKNRLEAVLEALPAGVAIIDAKGGNIRSNTMFEKIWGGPCPPTHTVGDYAKYKAWWLDTNEPVQPEEWASAVAVQKGKTVVGQLMRIERFDGVTAFIVNSAAPIFDANSEIVGSAVAISDITDRIKTEELLRQATEDWERTFNSVPDLIAILDDQHRILRINRAMATALHSEPEKCIGQYCFRCVHGTDKPPQFCPHASTLLDGREHTAEVHESRLDSDFIVTTTPMFDAAGHFTGAVHMAHDITEQKRAERVLRDMNETLERRVAERTAVVEQHALHLRRLAIELSRTEHREREQLAEILHDDLQQSLLAARLQLAGVKHGDEATMRTEIKKIDELLGECLRVSRDLTMKLSPPILHRGTLSEVLVWLGEWFGERHGLTVTVALQENAPSVPEPVRVFLFHAVRELLLNTVKHSGRRAARVLLSSQDGCLTVQVEDNGSNFDPKVVQHNLSRARSFGLFNIQERLEALDGRFDIATTTRGGACFRLTIPASAITATLHEQVQAESKETPQ